MTFKCCITTLLQVALAGSVLAGSVSAAQARPMGAARPLVTRPECQTKINYNLDNPPFWVFVMNFERVDEGNPVGCLLFYEAEGRVPRQHLLSDCAIKDDVAIANGEAVFNGGHVQCSVNLSALIGLAASVTYTTYSVFGMGTIAPTSVSQHPFGNPIGFYRSDQPGADLGLFAPATLVTGNHSLAVLKTMVVPMTSTAFFAPATPGSPQYWGVVFNGNKYPDPFNVIGELQLIVDGYTHQTMVVSGLTTFQFRADGGTFYVGGSPLGPNFRGVLDEVIIDPQNGGSPDRIVELGVPRIRSLFLPGVSR